MTRTNNDSSEMARWLQRNALYNEKGSKICTLEILFAGIATGCDGVKRTKLGDMLDEFIRLCRYAQYVGCEIRPNR